MDASDFVSSLAELQLELVVGVIAGIVAAFIFGRLKPHLPNQVADSERHRSSSMDGDLEKRPRRRLRPLLEPMPIFRYTDAPSIGRIPLQPSLESHGRLSYWRSIRLALLRPSSPKPAFMIKGWHHTSIDRLPGASDRPLRGGFRLTIHLHHRESRQHFKNSLEKRFAGVGRSSRTLLVTSLEDYLTDANLIHCFTVDRSETYCSKDRLDTMIVYSADPVIAGRESYRTVSKLHATTTRHMAVGI